MWPFGNSRQEKYDRSCKAAALVMLGAYYGPRLTELEKQRVDAELARMLTGAGSDFRGPVASNWVWDAAFRAGAMATVGIKLMNELTWQELLEPWEEKGMREVIHEPYGSTPIAARCLRDFHPMDPATEDAKRYLRSLGLEIPDIGPWSLPKTDGSGTIGPGEGPKARR